MILFMGLAAINTQANLLFGVFGLMIGIMLVSWIVSRVVVRQLEVRRAMPPHLVVGVPTILNYEFTNNKRYWASLSITLTELDGTGGFERPPQAYLLHATPGATVSVPCELSPKRRGVYEFNRLQLSSSFPFGFIKRSLMKSHREAMVIFPPMGEVERRLLSLCRSADEMGQSNRPRPGGTDEFYGVRQYRSGDNPRLIHWRRSARTGILVTREMSRVAPPRLLLAIDTFLAEPSPQQQALVERAIAMAASLASAALDDGLAVGIHAWASEPVSIAPARGKQQREDVLALLARLPANDSYPAEELLAEAQRHLRSAGTIVLVTPADMQGDRLLESRGGQLVISAAREETRNWFHFAKEIDFAKCSPIAPATKPKPARTQKSHTSAA
jgi:uncharacterized protein (DUF58 family)